MSLTHESSARKKTSLRLSSLDWVLLGIAGLGLAAHVLVDFQVRPALAEEAAVFRPAPGDLSAVTIIGQGPLFPGSSSPTSPQAKGTPEEVFRRRTAELNTKPLDLELYRLRIDAGHAAGHAAEVAADAVFLNKIRSVLRK